ncbi:glycoside hydrolase family 99-like domain-containing protein [Hymenobacter sp. GOD-10R]|uniref:glycosyltransferase WbsX family protein n=1 Tax=Hymenobacter sp. GOD-10R TaxID=3093922 RepID=UPI002D774C44|nr:glycoside hydrolase family 99-like domain-containing protein [Hymenobacter sp. GOD-10R]WRQ27461.1 glycoside hydrolase family 99-like domain-containing protein [Hymenobacter sp. GOD-10R]
MDNILHRVNLDIRALAIYLPQFHPIPENDEWWGMGFTEWTNVAKAQSRFPGHYQPQLPTDLGFYDLRVTETRQLQVDMARQYGIQGFCYYHYWFNGRRILERPFEEVLASGQPDFPFCLCWANENWTRRWDGQEAEVLLKQDYSKEDDLLHIQYLAKVFADPRYIRIDNKPVFIVYRTELFPNIRETVETWRKECIRLGIGEIYLIRVERFSGNTSPTETGFDAAMEFQPDGHDFPERYYGSLKEKLLVKAGLQTSPYQRDQVYLYEQYIENVMARPQAAYKKFPCVTPAWDNSARRKENALIIHGSTPALYEKWLKHASDTFIPYSKDENLLFINAWNEWAEGNHLEPCQKWGRQYLEATARVLLK